jgi:hypothetical protein
MSVGSARENYKLNRMFTHEITAPGCHPGRNAVASICEINPDGVPFMGNAGMKIYNVMPGNNVVWVRGEVDWDEPINVRVSVMYQ